MTGNTDATNPTAATTALANVATNAATLTVPGAAISAFRSSADAFVKISLAHTPDSGTAIINPVVVKI